MEIRIFLFYIYISCVLMPDLDAKPFSLNNIINAEERTSHNPEKILENSNNKVPQSKKISFLKYKKRFQIKSPSKPKKLKHLQKTKRRGKKLTSKREIQQNEETDNKYIPLLRNIGMLFDNILNSGSSETYNTRKYKRNQYNSNIDNDDACTCTKYDSEDKPFSQKKTSTTSSSTEVKDKTFRSTIVTATPTYNFTNDNISRFGRNKNIPLLLTRNTSSLWRNHNRFRERSGSSHNRSFEGHIAGLYRNNEHITNDRDGEPDTQYYEENSSSHSRDNTSGYRSSGRLRGIGRDSRNSKNNRSPDKELIFAANETVEDVRRNLPEHEGEIKFKIRRNETESAIFLPEFTSRLREYKSQEKNATLRFSESNEESFAYDYTSNKRIPSRNGSDTEKNKKNSGTNKAITPLPTLSNSSFPVGKVVMIFDGYSVARDVNGENKRKEKAIHIHSN